MRHRRAVDPDGREGAKELRHVEGGEIVFRIYYVRGKKTLLIEGKEKIWPYMNVFFITYLIFKITV